MAPTREGPLFAVEQSVITLIKKLASEVTQSPANLFAYGNTWNK